MLFRSLLHTPTNFYLPEVMAGLARARDAGLIKHFGVSIYETEHALDVVSSGQVDYIQIPYNVFDQRLDKTDFFALARLNGVMVFGRAPFLQGLLFMEPDEVPQHVARAAPYLAEFVQIVKRHRLDRAEACLQFSAAHEGIDRVVFGVDNLGQLDEDLAAVEKSPAGSCRQELQQCFVSMEKEIIFPSLWAKPQ